MNTNMTLRETLAQYPSHAVCKAKLEDLFEKMGRLDVEKQHLQTVGAHELRIEGVKVEMQSLIDLSDSIQRLLAVMTNQRSVVLDVENIYQEIVSGLLALNPAEAETEGDRQDLIEKSERLTKRLQEILATLKGFDAVEEGEELKDVRVETKKSVRTLLKEFFGEEVGAAGKLDRQLELVPSENERSLAVFFYKQANPKAKKPEQAVEKFFASKEYKTLRTQLVGQLRERPSAGPDVKAFVETEFAKLASMKTPEERESHAGGINWFLKKYDPYESGKSLVIPYRNSFSFRGTHPDKDMNARNRDFLLGLKYRFLHLGVNDIDFALPSYALVSLFGSGELDRFGVDDKWFQDNVHFNDHGGGYFNFAEWRANGNLSIKGKRLEGGQDAQTFEALVLKKMQEIARELAIPISALMGYNVGLQEKGLFAQLIRYVHSGLRVNTHTGVVESLLPGSEAMNQAGQINYESGRHEGEGVLARHLARQKMAFGPDDPTAEKFEPLDLAKISGFKDVPEGHSLPRALDQISEELTRIFEEIQKWANFGCSKRIDVTKEELRKLEDDLREFTNKALQRRFMVTTLSQMRDYLWEKQESFLSIGKNKLKRSIQSQIELIGEIDRGLESIAQFFIKHGVCDRVNLDSLTDEFIKYITEQIFDGRFVVGLNERLRPLVQEFERLRTAYYDIENAYNLMFDSEVAHYEKRRGCGDYNKPRKRTNEKSFRRYKLPSLQD